MADVKEKIALLLEIREHPEKYLPLTEHNRKVFPPRDDGTEWYDDPQYNLGWDVGLLPGNRPYFMECWATCGITMLTYFVSAKGIGRAKEKDLAKMLEDAGLFRILDPEHPRVKAVKFKVDSGNSFWSVNVTVGVEDEIYVDGGRYWPFRALNALNRADGKEKKNG